MQARVLPETDRPPSPTKLTSDPCSLPSVSRELRLTHKATLPQVPFVVPHPKSSTSFDTPPQPDAMPQPKSDQPSVSLLASYGIKVRDFAYESTLPPIAPVPRVPRQVQPGPRPLKRAREEYDKIDDEPSSQPVPSQGGRSVSDARHIEVSKKSKALERKLTEPASDASNLLSSRARTFTDLSGYDPLTDMTFPLRTLSIQFPAGPSTPAASQSNDPSQHSQPSSPSINTESEPYIHTPLVTPNGSLQWPDSPCQPTGDSLPVPEASSTDSQADEPPAPSPPPIASPSPMKPQISLLLPSPSIGLLRSSPSPPVAQRTFQAPPVDSENPRRAVSTEPSTATTPRYFLRKRPAASPQISPRPPSRARPTQPLPLPRQPPFSMQATHSAAKSHAISGSPRARTLRKSAKEGSMVAS